MANRRRIGIAVLAAVVMVVFSLLLSSVFDAAVTLSYRERLLFEFANEVRVFGKLCDRHVRGMNERQVVRLLQELEPSFEPFITDGLVNSQWVHVRMGANGVATGCELDQLVEEWSK